MSPDEISSGSIIFQNNWIKKKTTKWKFVLYKFYIIKLINSMYVKTIKTLEFV